MTAFRTLLLRHRALAALVVALALCLKALVPSGYMVGQGDKVLTVLVCDPSNSHAAAMQIAVPMKHESGGKSGDKGQQWQGHCAFSSLSMASLSGADPLLLGIAIAFILALGFAPAPPFAPRRISYIRPPLRGPPALA